MIFYESGILEIELMIVLVNFGKCLSKKHLNKCISSCWFLLISKQTDLTLCLVTTVQLWAHFKTQSALINAQYGCLSILHEGIIPPLYIVWYERMPTDTRQCLCLRNFSLCVWLQHFVYTALTGWTKTGSMQTFCMWHAELFVPNR